MRTRFERNRSALAYVLIGAACWMLVSAAFGMGAPATPEARASNVTLDRRNWMPVVLRDAFLSAFPAQKYYLTMSFVNGGSALSACAAGYHMASLWEIFDFAALDYDEPLGVGPFDATTGPPTGFNGWIRTGTFASNSSQPGTGNCSSYTSSNAAHYGTQVVLTPIWDGAATPIAPWAPIGAVCSATARVWCVQD